MPQRPNKQECVFEACHNLHARAEKITIDTISQELIKLGYRKGSNTDIARYKNRWRAQQQELDESTTALPQRPDKLTSVIDEIRAEARREANSELERYKAEVEITLKQLQDNINYSQHEIAELRHQNKQLATQLDEIERAKQTVSEEKNTLTTLLNTEMSEHKQRQALYNELHKNSSTEIQLLHQRLQETGQLHENIQLIHKDELGQLIEKMEQQRHQHIADLESVKGQKLRLEKELIKLTTTQQNLQALNQALHQQIKTLEKRLNEQQVQLDQGLQKLLIRLGTHEEKMVPAIAALHHAVETNLTEHKKDHDQLIEQQLSMLHEIEAINQNLRSANKS